MPKSNSVTAISFKDIGISSIHPAKQILSNVSGYVVRGGITAVLGPSASGKSLFMRALSGRVHDLKIAGEFFLEGNKVDCCNASNPIGFVPQDDILIGDLTARETLFNSAAMKRNKPASVIHQDVEAMLKVLGLTDVADGPIGNFVYRGLSGGQKKRVEIGAELVAAPLVLFLDEPTSGLDATIAFDVLKTIRDIVDASGGRLSVMMSIHQPNSRLLDLVDHIMILGGGTMNFFGTVPESIEYLGSIGFPPPDEYTPTDYFLSVSDRNFTGYSNINFGGSFSSSIMSEKLMAFLDTAACEGSRGVPYLYDNEESAVDGHFSATESGIVGDHIRFVDTGRGPAPFWRQYLVLLKRDYDMAARDPALYFLQVMLVLLFGFLVGAVFLRMKFRVDKSTQNIAGALLWMVFINAYMQIFKVYHLSRTNSRYKHERENNTYSVLAAFFADLTSTSLSILTYIPGIAVAYFMIGFPNEAFPFVMFVYWLTAVTAESMVNFISRAWADTTTAIIISQGTMVILTVFGGVFVPWNQIPIYWEWLQNMSIFTQAARSVTTHMNNYLDYSCVLTGGVCTAFGKVFECDAFPSDGVTCMVRGRTVQYVLSGSSKTESPWVAFGYLVLIFAVSRLGMLILMYYPAEKLAARIRKFFSSGVQEQINDVQIKNRMLEDQLTALIAHHHRDRDQTLDTIPFMKPLNASQMNNYENYNMEDMFEEEFRPKNMDAKTSAHCLTWTNLSLNLKKSGAVLLDNVSGSAQTGRVLALMGPSGAGKTTLLNALGNRAPYGIVTGEVTFGSRDFTTDDLYFVPQVDEVNGIFTLYEQIEYVGLLKCADREDMYRRLTIVLRALGLLDKTDALCSSLTGGELKKVSVGMGMISNPGVFFLDEPTTGLDSTAAYSIVKHLVDLAASLNIAVIMTIHQPAQMVFEMLQDLYIIEAGQMVYTGPLSCSEKYFANLGYTRAPKTSVPDFLMDLVTKPPSQHDSTWKTIYLDSKFAVNVTKEQRRLKGIAPPATPPPSGLSRFIQVLTFFTTYYGRDVGLYYQRLAYLVVVAFFAGTVFLQLVAETDYLVRYSGAVFFSIWICLFSAVAATGHFARDRRQAVEQVRNAVVSPAMYCFCQMLASVPFNFVCSLTFQSIFHWLSRINPNRESFIYSVLLTWGHLMLMDAFVLTVVEALKDAMLCVTFAMIVMGWLFLFAGFFVKVSDMPHWVRWISYITPTKYSFDGYLYQIFHSQSFSVSGTPNFVSGDYLLENLFTQKGVSSWAMFGTLLAWTTLIRLAHLGIFMFQVRHFRPKRVSTPAAATVESEVM